MTLDADALNQYTPYLTMGRPWIYVYKVIFSPFPVWEVSRKIVLLLIIFFATILLQKLVTFFPPLHSGPV
jgi:hypothetical protein